MHTAGRSRAQRFALFPTPREYRLQSRAPFRTLAHEQLQSLSQDSQFIVHGVTPGRRHVGAMNLVRGLGDATGQIESVGTSQPVRQRNAGNFSLQPHLELRDITHYFRNRNSIRAVRGKTIPRQIRHQRRRLAVQTLRTNLAEQRQRLRSARAIHRKLILHQCAATRLVA